MKIVVGFRSHHVSIELSHYLLPSGTQIELEPLTVLADQGVLHAGHQMHRTGDWWGDWYASHEFWLENADPCYALADPVSK